MNHEPLHPQDDDTLGLIDSFNLDAREEDGSSRLYNYPQISAMTEEAYHLAESGMTLPRAIRKVAFRHAAEAEMLNQSADGNPLDMSDREVCEHIDDISQMFRQLITYEMAIAVLFGANVGTTMTAWLSTLVRESYSRDFCSEYSAFGIFLQLMVQLNRIALHTQPQQEETAVSDLVDRVLHYIEENLAGKITLSDVAHHFFVSESTITQLFRKKMDVSFYHCVTQRRLIAAKALIDRNVKLEDVSQQVGFSDYSAFYRAFKKEYGISPVQYRKLQHY